MKSHVQISDLMSECSTVDPALVEKWDDLSIAERIARLESSQISDLKTAILRTSENSVAWIKRTNNLQRSWGALSALCYVMQGIDTSPRSILMNRTDGKVTVNRIMCRGHNHEDRVPLRLTHGTIRAFGRAGKNGAFMVEMKRSLRCFRKRALTLSGCVQYAVGEAPFDPVMIPRQYCAKYVKDAAGGWSGDVDMVYKRIADEFDVEGLVDQALAVDNIAKMPAKWMPWW
jgi:hypothetical protein